MKSDREIIAAPGRPPHMVRATVEHLGVCGNYHVQTLGRTPEEVAAEVTRIEEHHQKKAVRFRSLSGLWGQEFKAGGARLVVTDATIREIGSDVELYLGVSIDNGETLAPLPGMPLRIIYATVDDIPDNGAVLDILDGRIQEWADKQAAHQEYASRLNAVLGMGG